MKQLPKSVGAGNPHATFCGNRGRVTASGDPVAETLKDHPEATPQVLDAFCRNLYAPGFVYCVDRAFVSTVRTPCLVFGGQ